MSAMNRIYSGDWDVWYAYCAGMHRAQARSYLRRARVEEVRKTRAILMKNARVEWHEYLRAVAAMGQERSTVVPILRVVPS